MCQAFVLTHGGPAWYNRERVRSGKMVGRTEGRSRRLFHRMNDLSMTQDSRSRFGAGAEAWAGYNRRSRGRLRHEVTWRNLVPYLPELLEGQDPPRVLDAGGGSGELALRLVRGGYRVWLLDYAPEMLDQARRAARALSRDAQDRLSYCLLPAEQVGGAFSPGFFRVITCHTLVEYLAQPEATITELAALLGDGGLLSLSFVNRHAEVLRQVWSRGDPDGALHTLEDGRFGAGLFGIQGQSYTAEEVSGWLQPLGFTIAAVCGVRAFADQVPEEYMEEPAFLAALLQLETAAAQLDPYRQIARYVHVLARKDAGAS